MKHKNDSTNRNSTALAGAVAATNIGFSHLLSAALAAAGGRRIPEGNRASRGAAHSFCDGLRNLGGASNRPRPCCLRGLVACPLQAIRRAPTAQCKLSRQRAWQAQHAWACL